MNSIEKVKFLKSLTLFSSLSSPDLEVLGLLFHERKFSKGQFIFQDGDEPKGFFIVKKGKIKILKQSPSGKNIIIKIISRGEFMGEVALFNNTSYPASAQALEDIEVYDIYREDMLSFIKKYPSIIFKFIGACVGKLREAYAVIHELGTQNLDQRVAATLLTLAETTGQRKGNHIKLDISIDRQDLAEMVGCTKESVCRVMANLKRKGILKSYRRKIFILAPEELRKMATEIKE
jgi:CRP/FNR family transcriptional regulator